MRHPFLIFLVVCGAAVGLYRCAPRTVSMDPGTTQPSAETHSFYSLEKKLLTEADSLFKDKKYDEAVKVYAKIRDRYPSTSAGAKAQYTLGLINVFYNNPDADFTTALLEFKRFQSLYPVDGRIPLVNTWIRLLTALDNFNSAYHQGDSVLVKIKDKQRAIFRNYETLQDAYQRCDTRNDSLSQVIRKLEGVIDYLDKMK